MLAEVPYDGQLSLEAYCILAAVFLIIFGGLGQFYGPVLGSALFTYLEEILITNFPYYYMLIFGIILVIAILYLPEGLVGLMHKLGRRISGGRHAGT